MKLSICCDGVRIINVLHFLSHLSNDPYIGATDQCQSKSRYVFIYIVSLSALCLACSLSINYVYLCTYVCVVYAPCCLFFYLSRLSSSLSFPLSFFLFAFSKLTAEKSAVNQSVCLFYCLYIICMQCRPMQAWAIYHSMHGRKLPTMTSFLR